jgi:hypothetical protein
MTTRTRTIVLKASGMEVTISMPNLYQLVASHTKSANPMTARIIELLEGYGLIGPSTAAQRAQLAQDTLLGAMELASLCLVKPKLRLDATSERPLLDGEVGPEAFAYNDWTELLRLFRGDPEQKATPDNQQSGTASEGIQEG